MGQLEALLPDQGHYLLRHRLQPWPCLSAGARNVARRSPLSAHSPRLCSTSAGRHVRPDARDSTRVNSKLDPSARSRMRRSPRQPVCLGSLLSVSDDTQAPFPRVLPGSGAGHVQNGGEAARAVRVCRPCSIAWYSSLNRLSCPIVNMESFQWE